MENWMDKIRDDMLSKKVKDEERERFQTLSEGSHVIKIDLSTKDKMVITKEGYRDRTYILFNTVEFEKPYLKLTGYQYGLLLDKLQNVPDYPQLPKHVIVSAGVTREADDKLYFDISVVVGGNSDKSE